MQAAQGQTGKTTALGRKDGTGQDAVVTMDPVKERVEELIELYVKSGDAAAKFNEAIKTTAEKSGLLASTVRKFVVARAGEKFDEVKREVEQLALVFDEVGE